MRPLGWTGRRLWQTPTAVIETYAGRNRLAVGCLQRHGRSDADGVIVDKQIRVRMGQAYVKRWIPDVMPCLTEDDPLGVLIGCRSLRLRRRTACSSARPAARSRSCSSRGHDPTVIIQ